MFGFTCSAYVVNGVWCLFQGSLCLLVLGCRGGSLYALHHWVVQVDTPYNI